MGTDTTNLEAAYALTDYPTFLAAHLVCPGRADFDATAVQQKWSQVFNQVYTYAGYRKTAARPRAMRWPPEKQVGLE